jgi:hypothetical protein
LLAAADQLVNVKVFALALVDDDVEWLVRRFVQDERFTAASVTIAVLRMLNQNDTNRVMYLSDAEWIMMPNPLRVELAALSHSFSRSIGMSNTQVARLTRKQSDTSDLDWVKLIDPVRPTLARHANVVLTVLEALPEFSTPVVAMAKLILGDCNGQDSLEISDMGAKTIERLMAFELRSLMEYNKPIAPPRSTSIESAIDVDVPAPKTPAVLKRFEFPSPLDASDTFARVLWNRHDKDASRK